MTPTALQPVAAAVKRGGDLGADLLSLRRYLDGFEGGGFTLTLYAGSSSALVVEIEGEARPPRPAYAKHQFVSVSPLVAIEAASRATRAWGKSWPRRRTPRAP
jgi:hypothetical protein